MLPRVWPAGHPLTLSPILADARLSFFQQSSSLATRLSDVNYKKCKKETVERAGRRYRGEKHFEAERNFGAGVIDVFGRRASGQRRER